MSRLLALLLALLRPGAEEPPADPPPGDQPPPDDEEIVVDDTPNDDPPPPPASARPDELAAERDATRRERERADRFEREAAELRARNQRPPTPPEWEEEEKVLKDPNATQEQKWTVNANRQLRASNMLAQSALAQSQDINDRTAFSSVCISDPMAKRYQERVETELTRIRSQGQNASREAIYTYLLGQDMRGGKFKKKAAPAAAPAGERRTPPSVKSDTPGRGASLTDREKRRQRLENQPI